MKKIKQRLYKRKEKENGFFDTTNNVVLQIDTKGKIVYLNKFGQQKFGYKEKEVLGKNIIGTLIPKKTTSGDDLAKMVRNILKNPQRYIVNENENIRKDGKSMWFLWANKPVLDEKGKLRGILGVGTDITERKRKEEQTSEYFRNLEFLSTSAINFLSSMNYQSLFPFVGKRLLSLVRGGIVVVNEYDPLLESTIVRCVQGERGDVKKVIKILGKNLIGLTLNIPDNLRQRMLQGVLVKVTGGLYNLSFKNFPLSLCRRIERELNLGDIYAIPFILDSDFLGTVAVLLKKGKTLKNRHLIESFVSLSALAIKQKKVGESLAENEERFRAIFEDAAIGIVLSDMTGHPLEVNTTFQKMIGYPKEELKNMTFLDFTHSDDWSLDLGLFEDMKKGELESYSLEKRYIRKDGKVIYVLLTVSLIHDVYRKPKFTIGIIKDITERKKAEVELRESREKFEKIFRESPIGIGLHGAEGKLIDANDALLEMFGVSEIEQLRKFNMFDDPNLSENFKNRLRGGKSIRFEETLNFDEIKKLNLYNVKRSGFIVVDVSITPVFADKKGKIFGYLIQMHDITDKKEIEKRKDEFISIASHELKTPLTSLKGFSQIFQSKVADLHNETLNYYQSKMIKQINGLNELVDGLLDVSKIQTGRIEFNIEKVDINELVSESIENIQDTSEKHKIILKGKSKKKIYADRYRVSQVLTNLVVNAIKYSPEGRKVIIFISENKYFVTIKVKDFGVGISKEDQDRIFQRFYRVQSEAREGSGGLGLGLYISAEIVRRHGGRIWVRSKLGKGSTFYFTLPYKKSKIRGI